ncbi:MAG: DegV family protein [Christensenellales bacterium]
MNETFAISTDSTSDFFNEEINKLGLFVGKLNFTLEDKNGITEHLDDFKTYEEYVNFYNALRNGVVARTSILNFDAHVELFTKMAQSGIKNALHISQGMGLSPTVDRANEAIEEVKKQFPEINYVAIESNTTTVSEGNLVRIAIDLRNEGKSLDETVKILEDLKHKTQHFIAVNDLMHLKRGGRISGAAATIGTILQLKPIIEFTKEGKLSVVRKENGIKKALKSIVNEVKQNYSFNEKFAYPKVVHTDNIDGTKMLAEMIKQELGVEPEIRIMGPIIGAHVGPGAVAFTFVSNEQRKY